MILLPLVQLVHSVSVWIANEETNEIIARNVSKSPQWIDSFAPLEARWPESLHIDFGIRVNLLVMELIGKNNDYNSDYNDVV